MKPMIYKTTREIEILDEGVINNFHYCIVSYGTHPCAYIELPEAHEYYGLDYDAINIVCHGGLTYASDKGIIFDGSDNHRDGFWIGWDYAHYEDYMALLPHIGGRRYTTEGVYRDVEDVVEQLKIEEVEVEI